MYLKYKFGSQNKIIKFHLYIICCFINHHFLNNDILYKYNRIFIAIF